jgi:hypothetical protein
MPHHHTGDDMTTLTADNLSTLSTLLVDSALVASVGAEAFSLETLHRPIIVDRIMREYSVPHSVATVFVAHAEDMHHASILTE